MMVSYSVKKKSGKKKCEISSQWHFKPIFGDISAALVFEW